MKRRVFTISAVGAAGLCGLVFALATLHSGSSGPVLAKADANGVRNESVAWVKQAIAKGALVLDVRKDDEFTVDRRRVP
jgi:hypothetical protein